MVFTVTQELFEHAFFYKFRDEWQVWYWSVVIVYQIQARFLSTGLTMAVFHSSQNSPNARDRLMIWVITGRQASSICLRVLLGWCLVHKCLFFIFIITVCTSISVSDWKEENLGVSWCMALYVGMLVNASLISQFGIGRIWQTLLQVPHLFCWMARNLVLCVTC